MEAILALEDGTIFKGKSFGAELECEGEVVFNTSMTGYQEILTDPSYNSQIVTMTYPLIGNYGINPSDFESQKPQVSGFIVKEYCPYPSNWRSTIALGDFLKEHNIPGIEGIDTRALVRHIRRQGAMKGVLSTIDLDSDSLVQKARNFPGLIGRDLVQNVTCTEPYHWAEGLCDLKTGQTRHLRQNVKYRVAAYDFGIKHNILRYLVDRGCDVTVFPADTPAEQLLEIDPDGIFLSNGPGDPEPVTLCSRKHPQTDPRTPHLWNMSGPSAPRPGTGRKNVQTQIWSPGCQPARTARQHGQSRNHRTESRFLRRSQHPRPGSSITHPHQPQRQHPRGPAPPRTPRLLRPIPPRSLRRPARCRLSLRRICKIDGQGEITTGLNHHASTNHHRRRPGRCTRRACCPRCPPSPVHAGVSPRRVGTNCIAALG